MRVSPLASRVLAFFVLCSLSAPGGWVGSFCAFLAPVLLLCPTHLDLGQSGTPCLMDAGESPQGEGSRGGSASQHWLDGAIVPTERQGLVQGPALAGRWAWIGGVSDGSRWERDDEGIWRREQTTVLHLVVFDEGVRGRALTVSVSEWRDLIAVEGGATDLREAFERALRRGPPADQPSQ